MMLIRFAKIEDLPSCHEIDKLCDYYDYGTSNNIFQKTIKSNQLIICIRNGQLVGYIRFGFIWQDELPFVEMVRVIPEQRKVGIGSLLVENLVEHCKTKQYEYLISSTAKSNTRSQTFHEKLGFVNIGEVKLMSDKDPEIFFRLSVTNLSKQVNSSSLL